MAKLASARDSRMYGPRSSRSKWEYMNAGIYIFAVILLIGGFAAQLFAGRMDGKSGLVVILIGIALIAVVNAHDLIAHMAGIDHLISLVKFDFQLALVELAVPLVMMVGCILSFIGVLFLFIQAQRGRYSPKLENHALNLLIAGPALWVLGSVHNLCQVYERADGQIQILQKSVQIPFLMGSLLFFVGGAFNRSSVHHDFELLGKNWAWLCTAGSLLFLIGGVLNLVKVFKMYQMDGVRLERLRGGAQERLGREREGKVPLILEESRRRQMEEGKPGPTPYKDVLVSSHA